jgi:hypothetical protein
MNVICGAREQRVRLVGVPVSSFVCLSHLWCACLFFGVPVSSFPPISVASFPPDAYFSD